MSTIATQAPLAHFSAFWAQHRTLAIIFAILSAVGFGALSAGALLVMRTVMRSYIWRSEKCRAQLRPLRLPTALRERTQSTGARTHIGALIIHATLLPAVIARYSTPSVAPAPQIGRKSAALSVSRASQSRADSRGSSIAGSKHGAAKEIEQTASVQGDE